MIYNEFIIWSLANNYFDRLTGSKYYLFSHYIFFSLANNVFLEITLLCYIKKLFFLQFFFLMSSLFKKSKY